MKQQTLLSILIVSYNTHALTVQTLQSVWESLQKSPRLAEQTEVIVIDNASTDESVAEMKAAWRGWQKKTGWPAEMLQIIESQENLGFGRANNLGVAASKGELILFLNSDTIVQGDALAQMTELFAKFPISPQNEQTADLAGGLAKIDRLGILAASLLNTDGTPQHQGGDLPTVLSVATSLFFLDDLPFIGKFLPSVQKKERDPSTSLRMTKDALRTTLHPRGWVGGTAMMVRRSMLNEIGQFDPNIFMYGEDVELCLRAADHHWDVAVATKAHITHIGSASSSSAHALAGEFNAYLYIWAKHKPAWQRPLLKFLLKTSAHFKKFAFGTMKHDSARAAAYAAILRDVLR